MMDDPLHSLIHHHHCLSSSLLCFSYQPMGHMMKVKSQMIQRTAQNHHQTHPDLDLWKDLKGALKICFRVVLSDGEIQCSSPL